MQQFHWTRPTPYLGSRGVRRIAPRWQGALTYALDLTQTVQNYAIGAPGCTYFDWSPGGVILGNYIQITGVTPATQWGYTPDAFGVPISYLVNASGDQSIGPGPGAPIPATPTIGVSLSVWYRFDAAQGNFNCPLVRGTSGHEYGISFNTTQLGYAVDTSGGTSNLLFTITIPPGVWYHYGLTWDLTTMLCYLNGAFLGSKAIAGPAGSGNSGRWQSPGGLSDIGNTFPGSSRYPMVWTNRILTPGDMWELYANPSPYQEGFLDADISVGPPAGGGGGSSAGGGAGGAGPVLGLDAGPTAAYKNQYRPTILGL